MSADKDRGIRRIKQKRAKALKKLDRQRRDAGASQPPTGGSTASGRSASTRRP
jgi:hypothetical protein